MGAVLIQEGRLAAVHSKKLPLAEHDSSKIVCCSSCFQDRRLLPRWDGMHDGRWSCPLLYLQAQANLSRHQERWSECLKGFRFRWQYRPSRIYVANALISVQAALVTAAVTRGQSKTAVPTKPAADPSSQKRCTNLETSLKCRVRLSPISCHLEPTQLDNTLPVLAKLWQSLLATGKVLAKLTPLNF